MTSEKPELRDFAMHTHSNGDGHECLPGSSCFQPVQGDPAESFGAKSARPALWGFGSGPSSHEESSMDAMDLAT